MKNQIELLAPGGDVDAIKAAILAGANAVYCGLNKFNARSQAKNIEFDDLHGILRLAHKHDCEVFLTLNIIIVESEIPALFTLLNKLVNTQLDGIIIQDLGVFYIINTYFPSLNIHASTQMTTHNEGQIDFLNKLNATRVNLSRELNIDEITALSTKAHQHEMLTEVFVHGSNCISFSGLCYMSSVTGGKSGNRGQCSQPCRDEYLTTAEGKNFPLNIKDNSAFSDLEILANAGVDSMKIEGRIKKYHYVYTVVETWRKQLDEFYKENELNTDNGALRKVFNRDFSDSFLKGNMSRDIFIDNPRDNSAIYFAKKWQDSSSNSSDENLIKAKKVLFDQKSQIIENVESRIEKMSVDKAPLSITFSGEADSLLTVSIKTPDETFNFQSEIKLVPTNTDGANGIDNELITKRFKILKDTEYFIDEINLDKLDNGLFIPHKELSIFSSKVFAVINNAKEKILSVDAPKLSKEDNDEVTPSLSILISAEADLHLCQETDADIYFQLPNHFKDKVAHYLDLFRNNPRLIPWFPAVLIGDNYHAAVELLRQLKPMHIVTNNSGVAFAAFEKNIAWTAGPYMNLVNSYSLLCLKEEFNCVGAFISNEISQMQIKKIIKPENFKLSYSISHPIVLMTTIACMFHQVSGCKKNIVDDKCIQRCKNSASITNLKDVSYFIDKGKGEYHTVYNESNFLNTDIVTDIPNTFSNFFIDLRDIETGTEIEKDKIKIITDFENHLKGIPNAIAQLNKNMYPSTNTQYKRGI